ncbi:hypothetical protein ACTG9Q_13370 [Actinokineospora sp. 24-640]
MAATEQPWLVVLDVVQTRRPDRVVAPAPPTGRTLVTTRRRDTALTRAGQLIGIGLFTPPNPTPT